MGYQQTVSKWFLVGIMCLVACTSAETAPAATPTEQISPTFQASHTSLLPTAVPTTILPTATMTTTPTIIVATSTQTPQPTPTTLPLNAHDAMLLFARNDDLWWSDLNGDSVAPLTEGGRLNWGMDEQEDWLLAARTLMPQVSPNGRWLAYPVRDQPGLHLIDLATAVQIQLAEASPTAMAWTPDSQYLAYATTALFLYQAETGQVNELVAFKPGELGLIKNLLWSPDGQALAFSCCFYQRDPVTGAQFGEVQRVDIATSAIETVTETRATIGGGVESICWTEDGQIVTKTSIRQPGIASCSGIQLSASLSADGNLWANLGPASADDTFWQGPTKLTIESLTSGELLLAYETDVDIRWKIWSPDGDDLFLDNSLADSPIWRLILDSEELQVVLEEGYLLDVIPAWQVE